MRKTTLSESKKSSKGTGMPPPSNSDSGSEGMNPSPIPDTVEEDDDASIETPKFVQWITHGSGIYYPEFQVQLSNAIPTGYYGIGYDQRANKYFVRKADYATDNILELPMPEIKKIIKDITTFWKKEEDFRRYGLTYKRGILMYGPPGCGKSHVIQLIIKYLIETQKGVVFKIESPDDVEKYGNFMHSTFKIIEGSRRIVTIIEDIDGLFHANKSTETLLLNILDGMNHMDNIVYVATTNYPEELADRIINRPSRFDRRYEISLPNPEVRKFYLEHTLKPEDLKEIDINMWVDQTDTLSVAHLRELIVSTVIQGNTFEETMELLKDFNEKTPNSKKFGSKGKIGFGSSK